MIRVTEDASDVFARLGNETRTAILEALVDDEEGSARPVERGFTYLFEATNAETTAGFSYHLRQLRDSYVEQTDDGYRLTYAGLRVVRELAAGTYTESAALDPIDVPDPCPLCAGDLEAAGEDNVLTVTCRDCERDVLSLPFPPGGHETHEAEELLEAFDRRHRHRIALMRDGSCPDCGGATDREVVADGDQAQAKFECRACGHAIRCPVSLTALDYPAVVSLYHDHGEDARDRPVWNIGPGWTETVLSEDPANVRVDVRVDDDRLTLFVDERCAVVHTERTAADPPEPEQEDDGEVAGATAA